MLSEAEKRLHRCSFTGHRPERLRQSEYEIKAALEKEILRAIAEGFTVFISGMARGVDIWAAEIVLRLRDAGQHIRLICASPYCGFEQGWKESWKWKYSAIMRSADLIRFISSQYNGTCFQARNEWMVDHSAKVIAVYNGSPGGTRNTICYARKKGVSVSVITCEQ